MTMRSEEYMREAIRLAGENVISGKGGPFGAVIVKNGEIIASSFNRVILDNDPTAHAEIVAIREACIKLGTYQLEDCDIYSSCEPCPMCLGAIYWARPKRVFYACSRHDAAEAGFDDSLIYEEFEKNNEKRKIPAKQLLRNEGLVPFKLWQHSDQKVDY